MLLREVIASLVRRWYLTLAGLLVTAGLVALALAFVPPSWESKASLVLLPPKSSVPSGSNPYLSLGGLAPTLDLLVASLDDQQTRLDMQQLSQTAEYTVLADRSSSGPVLLIVAQDRTPEGAVAIRDELLRQSSDRLATLQSDLSIPERARITSSVLTFDGQPELAGRNRLRAVVVAVAAGLFGTLIVVSLIDGLLVRRREGSEDDAMAPPAQVDGVGGGAQSRAHTTATDSSVNPAGGGPDVILVSDADDDSIDAGAAAEGEEQAESPSVISVEEDDSASGWAWDDAESVNSDQGIESKTGRK